MAIKETIVTGRKFRRCTDPDTKSYQTYSFWGKASDCEFNDGTTAEAKLGAIKGITTDLNIATNGYAADMKTVGTAKKALETSLNTLTTKTTSLENNFKPSGSTSVTMGTMIQEIYNKLK